jgi:thiol-disulfide isomerase/thioredoxin
VISLNGCNVSRLERTKIKGNNMTKLITILITLLLSLNLMAQDSARPWLGVAIEEGKNGILVTNALADTPAQKAGIKSQDEIIKIDGKIVKTPRQLVDEVTSKGIGYTVAVELLRDGKTVKKQITLVGRPDLLDVAKKALLNKPAPDFEAEIVKGRDGDKFKLADQKGKVTLLEFWATWCPACVASYPRLTEFAIENKGKIDVITITSDEKKVIKKFLGKHSKKVPAMKKAPIVYLKTARGEGDVGNEYFANSIPMFVLLNKKNEVIALDVGGGSILEGMLKKALAESKK